MERNGNYYVGFRVKGRPIINKPPPFKDLNIRIPIITPIKGITTSTNRQERAKRVFRVGGHISPEALRTLPNNM